MHALKPIQTLPYGGRPKFVKFKPGDRGDHLPAVFFEDPKTFTPKPGPKGEIHAWGLYPYTYDNPEFTNPDPDTKNLPAFDGLQAMMRQMRYQMVYNFGRDDRPEDQFMDVILDRKRKQLAKFDLQGLDKRDVQLKIYVCFIKNANGELRIWRRVRVSAGMKIGVFQDKVLAPVMGWVRNLHCYTFTDYRDGALYGPKNANSIDVQHIAQVGYDYLPDDKYMLAHLFEKERDKFAYLYDFGDKWYHEIEVERIFREEESDGGVKIIDGKGMCPGENLHGSLQYHDFLRDYDKADYKKRAEMKREILDMPNYKGFGKPPSLFDPDTFDLTAATERLSAALSSTNSVRSGAKKFNMPMPGFEHATEMLGKMNLKKGQEIVVDPDPESRGYWEETTSTKKDKRAQAVCAECGKPGGQELKACSGCRQILYCSPEHQKTHWKSTHKKQCSRKFLKV